MKDALKRPWRFLLLIKDTIEKYFIRVIVQKHRLFNSFPLKHNKVVMDNALGKGYGDNPKYIAEELLRRDHSFSIIWLCNDTSTHFPKGVKPVYRYSIRAYYECATAKAWVFNTRHGKLLGKRDGQIFLQTWHGGIAIKKVERDAEDKLSDVYVASAKHDGLTADGILVDGKANEDLFHSSFWLGPNCELLKFGQPRIDILMNHKQDQELKAKTRRALNIEQDAFLVLYAPTFRNSHTCEQYISDFSKIKKAFEDRFGKTRIALRLHPNVTELANSFSYDKKSGLVNATTYDDVQELVISADCLITDYSSIAYDFALLRKPVFLYLKDVEEYIQERGVYPIFYEQPFPMSYNEEQLCETVREYSEEEIIQKIDDFYRKYPTYNRGDAAKQSADWLISRGLW